MPQSKQEHNKYMNDWKKENRERIDALYVKGTKARVTEVAKYLGESNGEFVRKAVEARLAEIESEMTKD